MISVNATCRILRCLAAGLGCLALVSMAYGQEGGTGFRLRVEPGTVTMRHTERPRLVVSVEDASGQPVDDVQVDFTVSEGVLTPDDGSSRTRNGRVTATFTPAVGADNPRRAFVVVAAGGLDVTVFIDIVPAIHGR